MEFQRNVRHALRVMCRNRGFSAVVVFALATGISSNTALVALFDMVMLRPTTSQGT